MQWLQYKRQHKTVAPMKKPALNRFKAGFCMPWWEVLVSNQRPIACEAIALPLS